MVIFDTVSSPAHPARDHWSASEASLQGLIVAGPAFHDGQSTPFSCALFQFPQ
jgi:hypothetical protein